MTGAGGHEAERLSVKVVPDTGDFAEKLKAFLEKEEEKAKIDVKLDIDPAAVEAKLKQLAKDLKVKIDVELNDDGIRQRIDALGRDIKVKIDVNLDAKGVRAKLARLAKDLTVKVNVDVDDAFAKAKLAALTRDRWVTIHISTNRSQFDQVFHAFSQMGMLARNATQQMSQGFQGVNRSAGGMSKSFGGMSKTMLAMIPVIAIIGGAIAGLVIIVGALAGALVLALAPVLFIGAAVAFEAMGQKGYGAAKKLSAAFKSVAKTAKEVVSSAVEPMTKAINDQIPKLNKWIRSLNGPLKQAFTSSSHYVDDLGRALKGFVQGALAGLNKALEDPNMALAMYGLQVLFEKLGKAIGLLFSGLAKNGDAFGLTLQAIGDAFVKMMPSFTEMLGMWARFSPELIESLTSALIGLFEALSDPSTLDTLSKFAKFSFYTILFSIQAIAAALTVTIWSWEIFIAVTKAAINYVIDNWKSFLGWLKGFWEAVKTTTSVAWLLIKTAILLYVYAMVGAVKAVFNGMRSFLSNLWSAIKADASTKVLLIKAAVLGAWNALKNGTTSVLNSIKNSFFSVWGVISGIVDRIAGAVSRVTSAVSSIKSAISSVNPFSAPADGPDPKSFPPPSGPMLMSIPTVEATGDIRPLSLYDDIDKMQAASATLNSSFRNSAQSGSTGRPSLADLKDLVQKAISITINAAPNVPTEETLIKALGYADALYA